MGGHNDFGERCKIPDWRIYKVENAPVLVELRDLLAQKGLKDPWIRNEVWRFQGDFGASYNECFQRFFFRGFKYGFAAFVATVAVETALQYSKGGKSDHGHH